MFLLRVIAYCLNLLDGSNQTFLICWTHRMTALLFFTFNNLTSVFVQQAADCSHGHSFKGDVFVYFFVYLQEKQNDILVAFVCLNICSFALLHNASSEVRLVLMLITFFGSLLTCIYVGIRRLCHVISVAFPVAVISQYCSMITVNYLKKKRNLCMHKHYLQLCLLLLFTEIV